MESVAELRRARRVGALRMFLGAALLAVACAGLWTDVEWIAQPFYAWAWWGYIFTLDGFCAVRRGHSLLTRARHLVLPMCVASITFWYLFELLNLHFQNWYYVGVFPGRTLLGLAGAALFVLSAFATVFVGLFTTFEALTASGLWRGWRGRPGKTLAPWVSYAVQGLGVAMAGTALLFPYYLAPLVWGSFTFLVDPWSYRRGTRSILRDIEVREWGGLTRLLLAGLVCGLVWESFNFFAPQKWIYTVRGLEGLKVFEMPLVGFLGFPALALDSLAGYTLSAWWLLGGASWEHPDDVGYELPTRPRPRTRTLWITLVLCVVFWRFVTKAALDHNVGSLQLELADVVWEQEERETLERLGLRRPRHLRRALLADAERELVQEELAWSDEELADVLARTELYLFKGIGSHYGALLEGVGVTSVEHLAPREPEELHAALAAAYVDPPRLDMVRVWVLASRSPGLVQR